MQEDVFTLKELKDIQKYINEEISILIENISKGVTLDRYKYLIKFGNKINNRIIFLIKNIKNK